MLVAVKACMYEPKTTVTYPTGACNDYLLRTRLLLSYKNMSGSLGEWEMLWEHKPQASVSTAFLSSPKLSQVFLQLGRNTEKTCNFSIFRKHWAEKKENKLLTLIIEM